MSAMPPPLSPPNNQDPPMPLLVRTARVGLGGMVNTLRVPGDPFEDKSGTWFKNDQAPFMQSGNQVKYMIEGEPAFKEMVAAIKTANGPSHFIYLLNWWLDVDFALTTDPSMTHGADKLNLRGLLTQADNFEVTIRAMAWDQQYSRHNTPAVEFIRTLKHGDAILDGRGNENLPVPVIGQVLKRYYGAQHQKILCVSGNQGLICFCGGVDFNSDRIVAQGSGTPLHDVHCRVLGPAALDLVHVFVQRWNDHPEGKASNLQHKFDPQSLVPGAATAPPGSPHFVRIGRTFGKDPKYGFAPHGEHTAADTILNGIRNAKKFVYTEDQYFVGNPDLEAALEQALNNGIKHFTAVITHWRICDMPQLVQHRRKFIHKLRKAGGNRVRIFGRNPITGPDETVQVLTANGPDIVPPDNSWVPKDKRATDPRFRDFDEGKIPFSYVHAKVWVVDDEFATIGSVNANRRGYTHDSEVVAGLYDTSRVDILTYRLAHKLRIGLWQEHLNMHGPQGEAELAYGVASAVHWLKDNRVPGTWAREYNEDEMSDGRDNLPVPVIGPLLFNNTDFIYNTFIDPA